MGLGDFFRRLFGRGGDPDEEKPVDKEAMREELDRYDEQITRGEVDLRKVQGELQRLQSAVNSAEENFRAGRVPELQKEVELLRIQVWRSELKTLKERSFILQKRVEMLRQIVAHHQIVNDLASSGVELPAIEKLAMEFEERMEKYKDTMNLVATLIGKQDIGVLSAKEKEDLKKLERELMGTKPAEETVRAPSVSERVPKEKAAPAKVMSEAEMEAEMAKLESEMAQREKDLKAAEVKEKPQTE